MISFEKMPQEFDGVAVFACLASHFDQALWQVGIETQTKSSRESSDVGWALEVRVQARPELVDSVFGFANENLGEFFSGGVVER
jgi:hypothetical protein